MPGILGFLGEIVKPITGLIDSMHTSEEEKLKAKGSLLAIQTEFAGKALEYEATLAKEQAAIVRAEVESQSWMARNWRPLTMLVFVYIIAHNHIFSPLFGVTSVPIPADMWDLLKLGMTGYIVGRSAEKVVPGVVEAMKAKER